MKQEVRYKDLIFARISIGGNRQGRHIEILPGRLNLFAKLTLGESQHIPRQLVGRVSLMRPKTVGDGLLLQTAALVFLPAAARTGVIPADLAVSVRKHNYRTLPPQVTGDNPAKNSHFVDSPRKEMHRVRTIPKTPALSGRVSQWILSRRKAPVPCPFSARGALVVAQQSQTARIGTFANLRMAERGGFEPPVQVLARTTV